MTKAVSSSTIFILALVALFAGAVLQSPLAKKTRPPDTIVFLADDLGFADVGAREI